MKFVEFMDILLREVEEKIEVEKVDFIWDYNYKDGLVGCEVIIEDDDDWDDWDDEEDDGYVIYVCD